MPTAYRSRVLDVWPIEGGADAPAAAMVRQRAEGGEIEPCAESHSSAVVPGGSRRAASLRQVCPGWSARRKPKMGNGD